MNPLTAHDLLALWERGRERHPLRRALDVLALAYPEHERAAFAGLGFGARDRVLLTLRQRMFGDRMPCVARCPGCAEELGFVLQTTQVMIAGPDPTPEAIFELRWEGVALRFCLPTCEGLARALDEAPTHAEARAALLARCVVEARREGAVIEVDTLPPAALARLCERMAELDPLAEILVRLVCPECEHEWAVVFDVASYLWAELSTRAERLVNEIVELARGLGWGEAELLGMSERRRRTYLEALR